MRTCTKLEVVQRLTTFWNKLDAAQSARLDVLLDDVERDAGLLRQCGEWSRKHGLASKRPYVRLQVRCLALGMMMADKGWTSGEGFDAFKMRHPDFSTDLGGWERSIKQTPQGKRQPLMDLLAEDREAAVPVDRELVFWGLTVITIGMLAVELGERKA